VLIWSSVEKELKLHPMHAAENESHDSMGCVRESPGRRDAEMTCVLFTSKAFVPHWSLMEIWTTACCTTSPTIPSPLHDTCTTAP
jgi:hypothetical protein